MVIFGTAYISGPADMDEQHLHRSAEQMARRSDAYIFIRYMVTLKALEGNGQGS